MMGPLPTDNSYSSGNARSLSPTASAPRPAVDRHRTEGLCGCAGMGTRGYGGSAPTAEGGYRSGGGGGGGGVPNTDMVRPSLLCPPAGGWPAGGLGGDRAMQLTDTSGARCVEID
eukprot:SAG25_NODE_75_length_16951_cov_86.523208_6_plen_115_part_00